MGVVKKIKYQIPNTKYIRSFTFIEMVVVIGVIGMALPILFGIVFNILQQQTKIYRLSQVKREGDYVLSTMENIIRNYAISIHNNTPTDENKICNSTNREQVIFFKDRFNNWFRFCRSPNGFDCSLPVENYIASESSILNNGRTAGISLTSSKVKIPNFSITCYRSALYSPPIVIISFTIQYNTLSDRPEDTAILTYQTKVKLRSY